MKYLKTYDKLFESNSTVITLEKESDWNLVNDSTTKIIVDYKCNKLHELPNSLQQLDCSNNQLTELPELPKHLTCLYIVNNNIEYLPELPNSLRYLFCWNNSIKEIIKLPESLIEFNCSKNKLTKLPELPNKLELLGCSNNNLTELPDFPKTLKYVYIGENPLNKLPNGISEETIKQQFKANKKWFNDNVITWIINKPTDYNILKDYLSEENKEKLENEHPEIISQNQFGMFGLKNQK